MNKVWQSSLKKVISGLMAFIFAVGSVGTSYAQNSLNLPVPGTMVSLSQPFVPPLLKGIKVYSDNPFRLDFILGKGDAGNGRDRFLRDESTRLIKYFLASVTVPEEDLWVNLSPYEKDRIVPDAFGVTEMGRDLLAQDYMLKQITASVIYPEGEIGKAFWAKVYAEAEKRYGTTDIPVDTFNKVWIVPEKAVVYENVKAGTAYVVESRLKVMLETDYLATSNNEMPTRGHDAPPQDNRRGLVSPSILPSEVGLEVRATEVSTESQAMTREILREIMIPILEKEVNEGKNFAQLRQVYQSLILATWFKDKIKESVFGKAYADQKKISGVDIKDKAAKEKIWAQYVEAFQRGAYNYIKEEYDSLTGETMPRKYFSGGITVLGLKRSLDKSHDPSRLPQDSSQDLIIKVGLDASEMAGTSQTTTPERFQGGVRHDQFQHWLGSFTSERLKNEVAILNILETLLRGLSTEDHWSVSEANTQALHELIVKRLVSKEELMKLTKEKGIVEILLRRLSAHNDWDARKVSADKINWLVVEGFVSKEEVMKKRGILEILLNVLGTDSHGGVRNACVEVLHRLITGGFVGKADLIKLIKEKKILEAIFRGLSAADDWNMRKASIVTIHGFIAEGLFSKEDVIRKEGVLDSLLRGLRTDSHWAVRRASVEALRALVVVGFINKEEVIKKEGVLEALLRAIGADEDGAVRKASVEAFDGLIAAGLVSKGDVARRKGAGETLLRVLSTDKVWDVRIASAQTLYGLLAAGLVSKEDIIKKGDVLETLLHVLIHDNHWAVRKASAQALQGLITEGLVSKENIIKVIKERRILDALLRELSAGEYILDLRKPSVIALQGLIVAGLVSKEEFIRKRGVLDLLVNMLSIDGDSDVRKISVVALQEFMTEGFSVKEDVIKLMKEKAIVEVLVSVLGVDGDSNVCKAIIDALQGFVAKGFISQEDVIKVIKEEGILETLLLGVSADSNWASLKASAEALHGLIVNSFIRKGDVVKLIKEEKRVKNLLNGLRDDYWAIRKDSVIALHVLIVEGLVSKEDVIKEEGVLATLLDVLKTDQNAEVRKEILGALNGLIIAGLISKEDGIKLIKEKGILGKLLRGLNADSYWAVRKENADVLKGFITEGLVSKEGGFSELEMDPIFADVYEKSLPSVTYLHNYLRILTVLKESPGAAYQLSVWSNEQLEELVGIFDAFLKGVSLDGSKKIEESEESLERKLITDAINLLHTPDAFLRHIKKKFKVVFNGGSMKLAIRVYEIASVNATKGFIQATGLNKENVVILYDQEIDTELAEKSFPGYTIQRFEQSSREPGLIRTSFHDAGYMRMEISGDSLTASLPYTPFKFNLPVRVSEEVNGMKASLGIGTRKVIVIGSPSDTEFNDFIQVYNSLYGKLSYSERPLIIVGFRKRRNENELKLFGSLSGQSIAVRSDAATPLPDVRSNNVLILNTIGELLKMYALANISVVGEDRNIFEPASQQAAVLYFEGSWRNNLEAKDALVEKGAAAIFSKDSLKRLINASAETEEMAMNGAKAVEKYREEVLFKAEESIFQIVGAQPQLRKELLQGAQGFDFAEEAPISPGGIDLTPALMDLKTTGSGEGITFNFDSKQLQQLQNASGLSPVIISIQPLDSLPQFLGVNEFAVQ